MIDGQDEYIAASGKENFRKIYLDILLELAVEHGYDYALNAAATMTAEALWRPRVNHRVVN